MKLKCSLGYACIDFVHCLQPSLISLTSFSLSAFKNYIVLANKLANTPCV